ncbi:hypothetical protein VTL71DRAFT_3485 [Oculimacula yallundae]|uniref:Uncharacterized protein n=1 Tax=Oculimacula yallundae TaxID=86028 RepID=A0ABR4C7W5_9HELO
MRQLSEAKSKEDNWTGTTDATARRRAQTRLATRAYRKRKALEKKTEASTTDIVILLKSDPSVRCWDIEQNSVCNIPSSNIKHFFNPKHPILPKQPRAQLLNIVFPLSPDHLITLQQYNALRALAVNRTFISGILTTPLDCADEEIIHVVPYPTDDSLIPPPLLPTLLQQTVPHPDWIDCFPSPTGRDRLILATGTYDEDDLWKDCIGGLYEGFPDDEVAKRGIVAWSPPWSIEGWEVSEGFLTKWGWLLGGLPGELEYTNRWRAERGEEPLVYDEKETLTRVCETDEAA